MTKQSKPFPSAQDILVWPDDTWCERIDFAQMNHRSDDYRVLFVGEPDYLAFMHEQYPEEFPQPEPVKEHEYADNASTSPSTVG